MRCPLCATILPPEAKACPCCELRWPDKPPAPDDGRIAAAMQQSRLRFEGGWIQADGLSLSLETLRAAASRYGRSTRPDGWMSKGLDVMSRRWLRFDIVLEDAVPADAPLPLSVTLGCIARATDIDALRERLALYGSLFRRWVIVIDGSAGDAHDVAHHLSGTGLTGIELDVTAAPLDDDYGAQRNRVQDRAAGGWVFHLDTDEWLDESLFRNLGWAVADAHLYRSHAIGFPRTNMVDGVRSAFYPDIQYRLVRSHVRFSGLVHETPLGDLPWWKIHVSLAGTIVHEMSRIRAIERSERYERISVGGGKPDDERLLLTPWADRG